MNRNKYIVLLIIGLLLAGLPACGGQEASDNSVDDLYLWSHNDYEQQQPLQMALDLGYQMIEADIHLIDGELYVVHDHPTNLEETPLLEDLYLTPLSDRIERNHGKVLTESDQPFYLVIDVKTEADPTFETLLATLEPNKKLFYRKEEGKWINGPIRLLISGNRPSIDPETSNQMVFIDGRLQNIGMGYSPDVYPLISDNWFNYFTWDGTGEIPEDELQKLREYVAKVHEEGKMIRFWGTPDREMVWQTLINNGVDVINVDDLEGMRNFIESE